MWQIMTKNTTINEVANFDEGGGAETSQWPYIQLRKTGKFNVSSGTRTSIKLKQLLNGINAVIDSCLYIANNGAIILLRDALSICNSVFTDNEEMDRKVLSTLTDE